MKDFYPKKNEEQRGEEQAKILPFKAKPKQAYAKIAYYGQIKPTRINQATAQQRWQAIEPASGSVWERFKAGLEYAWNDLKQAFDHATAKLK
jgi:hypothetical protein